MGAWFSDVAFIFLFLKLFEFKNRRRYFMNHPRILVYHEVKTLSKRETYKQKEKLLSALI